MVKNFGREQKVFVWLPDKDLQAFQFLPPHFRQEFLLLNLCLFSGKVLCLRLAFCPVVSGWKNSEQVELGRSHQVGKLYPPRIRTRVGRSDRRERRALAYNHFLKDSNFEINSSCNPLATLNRSSYFFT